MISKINLAIELNSADLQLDRQPVVVYDSRVDSLLNNLTLSAKQSVITDITADWMLFMDDFYSKMIGKISL